MKGIGKKLIPFVVSLMEFSEFFHMRCYTAA